MYYIIVSNVISNRADISMSVALLLKCSCASFTEDASTSLGAKAHLTALVKKLIGFRRTFISNDEASLWQSS